MGEIPKILLAFLIAALVVPAAVGFFGGLILGLVDAFLTPCKEKRDEERLQGNIMHGKLAVMLCGYAFTGLTIAAIALLAMGNTYAAARCGIGAAIMFCIQILMIHRLSARGMWVGKA